MDSKIRRQTGVSLILVATLMVVVVPVSRVSAQVSTPTPHPTLTPITTPILPGSPLSNVSAECSGSQPIGYGIITPSVGWLAVCGACMPTEVFNPTSIPTSTPHLICGGQAGNPNTTTTPVCNTATPGPTDTPVPATSTPGDNGSYIIMSSNSCDAGNICEQLSTTSWHVTLNSDGTNGSAGWTQAVAINLTVPTRVYMMFKTVDTTYSVSNASELSGAGFDSRVGFTQRFNDMTQYSWLSTPSLVSGNPSGNTGYYEGTGQEKYVFNYIDLPASWEAYYVGFLDTLTWNGVGYVDRNGVSFWISLSPLESPSTPVATSTANPNANYCAQIVNDADEIANSPFRVGVGNVTSQSCYTVPEIGTEGLIDFAKLVAGFFTTMNGSNWFENMLNQVPVGTIVRQTTICIRSRDFTLVAFGINFPATLVIAFAIYMTAFRMLGFNPGGGKKSGGKMKDDIGKV